MPIVVLFFLLGSPPRMRGKAIGVDVIGAMSRITPACAGKRGRCCPDRLRCWDHPRLCGEKIIAHVIPKLAQGSPPRMRGKVLTIPTSSNCVGITPACAGKSSRNETCWHRPWDHPCVCGEKIEMPYELLLKEGSPPRMRGKARSRCFVVEVMRITPAYAGKRCRSPAFRSMPWDHPRVCGEKSAGANVIGLSLGSPPRVRGKAAEPRASHGPQGITPACAGKSSIQHLTASLGEFEVQKGHPVPHLRQRLQVWPDHARHLRHGLILHASRSAGQGRRLCPGPCPDTAGSGTPRGPSPAKRPHTSPPAATPGGCRAWQSGATAPGSR